VETEQADIELPECCAVTPEPSALDETANDSDDSPADGIKGDHTGQHECQDD
jgi:hypothetical protein